MPADPEKPSRKPDETSGETPRTKGAAGPELSADLVSFTIDVKSGRIAKVEAVDPSGSRHALSEEEASRLAMRHVATLEDVLERAFEAGISAVLDDAPLEDTEAETEAETEEESRLRRMILRPMIEKSAAGRLLKREVLGRAILGTLIQDAVASQTSAPKAAPSPSRPAAASGSRRPPPRGRPH